MRLYGGIVSAGLSAWQMSFVSSLIEDGSPGEILVWVGLGFLILSLAAAYVDAIGFPWNTLGATIGLMMSIILLVIIARYQPVASIEFTTNDLPIVHTGLIIACVLLALIMSVQTMLGVRGR